MRVPTQKSFIEQQLPVFPESDNTHDKKAVAVYKDGSVVGHVPQELFCSLPDYPTHLPTRSCTFTIHTHLQWNSCTTATSESHTICIMYVAIDLHRNIIKDWTRHADHSS